MRAFVIAGKHNAYFDERPMPAIENGRYVRVKVRSCGLCGTDIHIYEGEHAMSVGQLRIPGHEFAGEVVEVGSDVKRLKPGDRVVHEPIRYCGECYACRHNQGNVCSKIEVSGGNRSGGWQEYFAAEEKQWHKIPDWMTWEEAALVEPYTIAAQANSQAGVAAGDVVLIHGGGPIGLMTADTAKHFGATVILAEIMEGRLRLAHEIGVHYVIDAKAHNVSEEVMRITEGLGPNVVFDCAGVPSVASDALRILAPAGRFVPVAGSRFECESSYLVMKQLSIIGCRLQMDKFEPVIARFALYREHADKMITNVFSFEETDKAFRFAAARHPSTGKIVVRFR